MVFSKSRGSKYIAAVSKKMVVCVDSKSGSDEADLVEADVTKNVEIHEFFNSYSRLMVT